MKKVLVVIPARMAASRFPGKPLAMIAGLPMIEHVRRRALLAEGISDVVVATCDQVIMDAVASFGGKAVMTSDKHERCTDRVAEAAEAFTTDVVVNVQGDEPLLFPESINQAANPLLGEDEAVCVSLLSPLESDVDYANTNVVKASCNLRGEVMYFSRGAIPYFQKSGTPPVFRETGIRALRADFLKEYASLTETPLERIESVDMFRLLEHGRKIVGVPTAYATMGVDHISDIEIVENIFRTDVKQRELLERIKACS